MSQMSFNLTKELYSERKTRFVSCVKARFLDLRLTFQNVAK